MTFGHEAKRQQRQLLFINKSVNTHGRRFSYHHIHFVGLRYTVELVCLKHDLKFTVIAQKHLTTECGGCPRCAAELVLNQSD